MSPHEAHRRCEARPARGVVLSLAGAANRAQLELRALAAVTRAGLLGPQRPDRLVAGLRALHGFGPFGAAVHIAALRHGDCVAIADERGEITFAELDEQINRLAAAFRADGLGPGSTLGILCRNHRAPLIAAFAASRRGMNAVWLNTAFSARQANEVAEREGVELLLHDADLADRVAAIAPRHGQIACDVTAEADELDALIARGSPELPSPPAQPGRLVLLTSGTTGTPKGAPRAEPKGLILPASLLGRMPMRSREATVIGPPLYHGTGLTLALLSLGLGSKIVLRRSFDPARFLDDSAAHRATTWCVVPIMLQRLLALGDDEVRRRDLSALRIVFCAGSQLPADVALRFSDVAGDVIYNLYGSTEVSVATLATPEDVRAAPTSVGKPALGSTVKLLDEHGRPVPPGAKGRIFVGTTTPFEGYTGGGHKEIVDGLMSTGDVGHVDAEGRLYIDGRDDEMIVSGGENVFPREVEELLLTHPAVHDAAVVGVEDAEFGQRLRAFVVCSDGAEATADELRGFVKENLARYKVPRDVLFLLELPRNPTGKVLKRELQALEAG